MGAHPYLSHNRVTEEFLTAPQFELGLVMRCFFDDAIRLFIRGICASVDTPVPLASLPKGRETCSSLKCLISWIAASKRRRWEDHSRSLIAFSRRLRHLPRTRHQGLTRWLSESSYESSTLCLCRCSLPSVRPRYR